MKKALFVAFFLTSAALAQQQHVWVLPEANAPGLRRVLFESKAAGQPVSCYVFTPKAYDAEKERRFPVLYWLHGSGGRLSNKMPAGCAPAY